MWGDDFENADVLDVHTTAAYKYATTAGPSFENGINGTGDKDRGKNARAATFSDVNKMKLSALMTATTGEDPARIGRKLKKKRKKTKVSAPGVPRISSANGDTREPGSAMLSKNQSTRRVKTAYNDDEYRALDGTMPVAIETVEPFDQKSLTHIELFSVGVQRFIPSQAKHNKTYIQKLLPAEDMVKAGSNFRKTTNLGGAISLENKQQTTAKAPEWIDLRDNYMRQVQVSAAKIIKAMELAKETKTQNTLTAADKHHFLLLLVAQRKVTLRIVSEYQFQVSKHASDLIDNAPLHASLSVLRNYLADIPKCLDHLDRAPFTSWLGISPSLNPFLTMHKLDGTSATANTASASAKASPVLEMTPDESVHCLDMSATLWDLYQDSLIRPRRPFPANKCADSSDEEDSNSPTIEDSAMLYREGQNSKIKLQILRASQSVHAAMHVGREIKAFTMGLAPVRTYWKIWRRSFTNEGRVSVATKTRHARNRRIVFDRLVHNTWQSLKFRSLQQNYHKRIVVITFGAWNEYRKWCRRFQNLYSRSSTHLKRFFMSAWKRFTAECDDLRTFRRRSKNRVYSIAFAAFKHNTKLSKFELKKRLERRSTSTFQDRHIIRRVFSTWAKRNEMIVKLDALEDFVEKIELKQAVIRWVLLTFGPRSQRRARSVAKAKLYMSSLRSSFEKKVSKTYKFISEGLSKMSPMMSSADKLALEEQRRVTGEASRRMRMQAALDYAQKTYSTEAEVEVKNETKKSPQPLADGRKGDKKK